MTSEDGLSCKLRSLEIRNPATTFCADHQDYTSKPSRRPTGPVLIDTESGRSILALSPNREKIHKHLLDIVETIQVRRASDMTLRQATALWQLEEWKDRRVFHYRDRIDFDIHRGETGKKARSILDIHGLITDTVLQAYVQDHGDARTTDTIDRDRDPGAAFVESFTLAGRIVVLSFLLVLTVCIAITVKYSIEFGIPRIVAYPMAIGIPTAYVLATSTICRWLSIRLRSEPCVSNTPADGSSRHGGNSEL